MASHPAAMTNLSRLERLPTEIRQIIYSYLGLPVTGGYLWVNACGRSSPSRFTDVLASVTNVRGLRQDTNLEIKSQIDFIRFQDYAGVYAEDRHLLGVPQNLVVHCSIAVAAFNRHHMVVVDKFPNLFDVSKFLRNDIMALFFGDNEVYIRDHLTADPSIADSICPEWGVGERHIFPSTMSYLTSIEIDSTRCSTGSSAFSPFEFGYTLRSLQVIAAQCCRLRRLTYVVWSGSGEIVQDLLSRELNVNPFLRALHEFVATSCSEDLQVLKIRDVSRSGLNATLRREDFDKACHFAAAAICDWIQRQLRDDFDEPADPVIDMSTVQGHDFQDGCCKTAVAGPGF